MGWVKDKFVEQELFRSGTTLLWNQVRDAIGLAVLEFNEQVHNELDAASHSPCTANGKFCIRVQKDKFKDFWIEVFLDEKARTISILEDRKAKIIGGYRATEDRKSLELFELKVNHTITVDDACKFAIGDFLFTPAPRSRK